MKTELPRHVIVAAVLLSCAPGLAPAQTSLQIVQQIGTVFVIPLENHNFTQPNPTSSPQQIKGNVAAPFVNSLITPGNANAAHVSYATKYYNAGLGVHPSEPSYVWSEAGTTFGVLTDNDPSAGSGNIFNAPHLTRQLNAAGISWRDYQEDVQLSSSPTVSASGTSSTVTNPYNHSHQYGYAVKHNPMAFFSDTQTQNVYPLARFFTDLTNNAVGRYNWITPDLYNEMHSALSAGFTYHGTAYTGDQAAVAEGDNFLAIVIPQIMASRAYQNNGVIIIWTDESEGGDTTSYPLPEIIISPLAKGNAYASTVVMSHSSDLRTMEELFGLSFVTNAIPAAEVAATGGYYYVTNANDLSDLLQAVPAMGLQQPANSNLTSGVSVVNFGTLNTGSGLSKSFLVTNSGLATLNLTAASITGVNAGDFKVSGMTFPAAVAAGRSTAFNVAFSPTAGGVRSAMLQITNSDSSHNRDPFTVTLTGAGLGSLSGELGAGGYQLAFTAAAGQTYRVLATENAAQPLSNWVVLATGVVTTNPVVYLDATALTKQGQFYRVVLP